MPVIGGEIVISIHAPRAGSDLSGHGFRYADNAFQSTLPVRGATEWKDLHTSNIKISIHAPRAGSDW